MRSGNDGRCVQGNLRFAPYGYWITLLVLIYKTHPGFSPRQSHGEGAPDFETPKTEGKQKA